MAVVHVGNTGTRSSGLSTADDWSPANVYPIGSFTTALAALGDGDALIFDAQAIEAADLSLNGALTSSTITITSRNGGGSLVLRDAVTQMLLHTSANAHNFIFEDIALDGNQIPWAVNNESILAFTQNCASLRFRRTTFRNFRSADTVGRTLGLLLRYAVTPAAAPITFEKTCVFEDFDLATAGDFQGLMKAEGDEIWTIAGAFRRIVCAVSAGNNLGLVYHTGAANLRIEDLALNAITMSGIVGQSCGGFVRQSGTPGHISVDRFNIAGMTMSTPGSTDSVFQVITADGQVRNGTVHHLFRTGRETGAGGNSVGGVVQSNGSGAHATVEDVHVEDSGGFFGTVVYNTGGASLTARRCSGKNLTDNGQLAQGGSTPVNGVGFYSGGDGNSTWEACKLDGVTGTATTGLGLLAQHVDRGGAGKTHTERNCTWTRVGNGTQKACRYDGAFNLQTFTVNTVNGIYDNGTDDVELLENSGGTLNYTMTNGHVTEGLGAVDGADVVNGTVALNSPSSGDPQFDTETGEPGLAAIQTGGSRWWTPTDGRPSGVDGRPFPDWDISIGAIQSGSVPFHPTQL